MIDSLLGPVRTTCAMLVVVGGKIIARRLLRHSYHLSRLYGTWRFRGNQNHNQQPLLVYQMGKLGSRSVYEALLPLRHSYSLYHVHMLDQELIDAAQRAYQQAFKVRPVIPDHLIASMHLLRDLAAGQPNGRWKVVTVVREPVARNVSSFFQDLELQHPDFPLTEKRELLSTEQLVSELIELFLADHDHLEPLEWCDTELRDVLGIDVYAAPFPYQRGWEIYQSPLADVLLLRLEDLRTAMPQAILSFFDGFETSVPVANAAADKSYSKLYSEFTEKLQLPKSYLDLMYQSRFARHFYSLAEIAAFYNYWSNI